MASLKPLASRAEFIHRLRLVASPNKAEIFALSSFLGKKSRFFTHLRRFSWDRLLFEGAVQPFQAPFSAFKAPAQSDSSLRKAVFGVFPSAKAAEPVVNVHVAAL